MSSWLKGVKKYAKAKNPTGLYYDVSNTTEVSDTYLELLGAYIFCRKQNQLCNIYDPNGLIFASIKYNTQLKVVKELNDTLTSISLQSIMSTIETMKLNDIQKFAAELFHYTLQFNKSITDVIQKSYVRPNFDMAVHLVTDDSGSNFQFYLDAVKEYQKKSKKPKMTVYVMANSFNQVEQFKKLCDPSWNLTSLSKTPPTSVTALIFQQLAEVQIFAVIPAVVLNFDFAIDRFIYIMQRNTRGYDFFRELNGKTWSLSGNTVLPIASPAIIPSSTHVSPPAISSPAVSSPAPPAAATEGQTIRIDENLSTNIARIREIALEHSLTPEETALLLKAVLTNGNI